MSPVIDINVIGINRESSPEKLRIMFLTSAVVFQSKLLFQKTKGWWYSGFSKDISKGPTSVSRDKMF